MITWTPSGRESFDQHVASVRARLAATGADVDEVTDDLRRHVEAELATEHIAVATREDVQRVLARMGAITGETDTPHDDADGDMSSPAVPPQEPLTPTKSSTAALIIFGVVLPGITLLLELILHLCGEVFFNPIPTLGHALAIALVPVANGLALKFRHERGAPPAWLGALNGAAFAVALIYALMFLPLSPFALVGILFFGIGFLPLSPLGGFISAWVLRRRFRLYAKASGARMQGWKLGVALAVLGMIGLETPSLLTHIGTRMALSTDTKTEMLGLRMLRAVGSDNVLLHACYPTEAWGTDLVSMLFSLSDRVSADRTRVLYYRVTGQPFNHVPPPVRFDASGRRRAREWTWDADQAGQKVGQRIRDLSLAQSRIDGTANGDALAGYLEWTMVFKNDAPITREARAQILLPAGGVVSRLTLWVDGVEQEAAFGGRAQVRAAYQQVVQRRRDPVLVTTKGPDRILMQCFPVPANGGEIKLRIGMSVPLQLETSDTAVLPLPRIVEQNFGSAAALVHHVWIESEQPMRTGTAGLKAEGAGTRHAMRGALAADTFASGTVAIRISRDPGATQAWSTHASAPDDVVLQRIETSPAPEPARPVALVVDGSAALREVLPEVARAIEGMPETAGALSVIFAGDDVERFEAATPKAAAEWLRQRAFIGGQDNLDALATAWDAVSARSGSILWIHGPQGESWQSEEALLQREARQPGAVEIRAFMAAAGSNPILEKLEGLPRVSASPRYDALATDLGRELRRVARGDGILVRRSKEKLAGDEPAGRRETGGHIARLWAAEEVARLATGSRTRRAEAPLLATKYQLVTPVSGAVVLETKMQFEAAGLKQVDPATTPIVPEPATVALILGGAALVFVVWKRRGRRLNG